MWWKDSYTLDQFHDRLKVVPNIQIARVEDAGHMLHHDQPEAVAQLIENFII
jgi:pimeloyl-ACP methyl ester carboxylesterase